MKGVMKWLLQNTKIPATTDSKGYHRVQEALRESKTPKPNSESDRDSESKVELDQILTYSATELLRQKLFNPICIHSQLKQEERIKNYDLFKANGSRLLVATDLFGRGIDIERVNLVINYGKS